jgi:hypothetical protein
MLASKGGANPSEATNGPALKGYLLYAFQQILDLCGSDWPEKNISLIKFYTTNTRGLYCKTFTVVIYYGNEVNISVC